MRAGWTFLVAASAGFLLSLFLGGFALDRMHLVEAASIVGLAMWLVSTCGVAFVVFEGVRIYEGADPARFRRYVLVAGGAGWLFGSLGALIAILEITTAV